MCYYGIFKQPLILYMLKPFLWKYKHTKFLTLITHTKFHTIIRNRRREITIWCKTIKSLKTCTRKEEHRFYKGNNIVFPSWTAEEMPCTFCCQPSQRPATFGLCFKITCLRTILSSRYLKRNQEVETHFRHMQTGWSSLNPQPGPVLCPP